MKLFHDVRSIMGWDTKLGDVERIVQQSETLRNDRFNCTIFSTKGSGKSFLLKWIETNYPNCRVCEGDVITIAARALDQKFDLDLTLGQCAKRSVGGKTLWDLYDSKRAAAVAKSFLSKFEDSLDFYTAFRGCSYDQAIMMITDYRSYAKQYRLRTQEMIKQARSNRQTAWRQHIENEHVVKEYTQYLDDIKVKLDILCNDSIPAHIFFNPGSGTLLFNSQFDRILASCRLVTEDLNYVAPNTYIDRATNG